MEGPRKFIAVLLLSIGLAFAVYELVERPVSMLARGKGKQMFDHFNHL